MAEEENKELYINGKKMPFSLEKLLAILNAVQVNLPKAFESAERGEDLEKLDDLLDELNNL